MDDTPARPATDRFRVGAAEVVRVTEWVGTLSTVDALFPDTPAQVWDDDASLAPHHYEPTHRAYRLAVQTWVVRTAGTTVLVDTGVGDDRDRPQAPLFDHLETGFLARLAAAGVEPEDVDLVINTHIHYDHVGWNTRRGRDGWEPTFPAATYVVPRADHDHFHPDNHDRVLAARTEDEARRLAGSQLVFADSIAPVHAAGQLLTWQDALDLPGGLHLRPAPGHTPGSSVVWLDEGPGAVFVGDLLHSPVQLARPQDACSFDLEPDQARRARQDVLAQAAGKAALVLPAHMAGHGGMVVEQPDADAGAFRVARWADLSLQ